MPGDGSPAGGPTGAAPELRASHADRDRVVDVLRVSAGEGRLTGDELEERVEAALTARTLGELASLTADLPAVAHAGEVAEVAAEAKDLVRIEQRFGPVQRRGRWVVPRRMELATEWCEVSLDFTRAVTTRSTLVIDLDMRGKTLTLLTRPGIVVDADALTLEHCKVRNREAPAPESPVDLRIELTGKKSFGRVVVQPPQRSLGRRLWGRSG